VAYFDWLGRSITQEQWARLFEDERHIGDDKIDDVHVSTVYVGISLGLGPPPLIFETMIFGGELEGHTWRYSSEREAREGHAHVLELVRAHICAG
jgi:hypothetical protein